MYNLPVKNKFPPNLVFILLEERIETPRMLPPGVWGMGWGTPWQKRKNRYQNFCLIVLMVNIFPIKILFKITLITLPQSTNSPN